jgi:hypothetical protein
LELADLAMPKGRMRLTRSLTSGLTRSVADPDNEFWGIGDRGPNLKPKFALKRYGLIALEPFAGLEGAKVMPLPGEGPSLARFRIDGERVELVAVVRLHGATGEPLSGLPPPTDPEQETEPALGIDGSVLGCAADGADTEGIAALPDGRFWIAEEYGPSLLLVSRTGQVERRVVPAGSERFFAGAQVPIDPALPPLAAARKLNRGFEALALSPDNALLYLAFQSPLAHPDRAAHEGSDLIRLWALDPQTCALQREYAYPLDPPEMFRRDLAAGPVRRDDIKVSELTCLPDGSLLVLERVTLSTRIYRVRPAAAEPLPAEFDDPAHRPTLEQLGRAGAEAAGVPVLAKELVFDTNDLPQIDGDLEGLIVLAADTMLLANDSDYGTEGAETRFWKVTLPVGALD